MIFQTIRQPNKMDCGPTCLFMISKYHGHHINIEKIRQYIQLGKEGVYIYGISNAAEQIGFRTLSVELSFEKIIKEAPLPCIVQWNQKHFILVTPNSSLKKIEVADPAHGITKYTREEFCKHWLQTTDNVPGIALLLEHTPEFYQQKNSKAPGASWDFLLRYLKVYKRYFISSAREFDYWRYNSFSSYFPTQVIRSYL